MPGRGDNKIDGTGLEAQEEWMGYITKRRFPFKGLPETAGQTSGRVVGGGPGEDFLKFADDVGLSNLINNKFFVPWCSALESMRTESHP